MATINEVPVSNKADFTPRRLEQILLKGDPAVKERPFLPDESPAAYRRRVNGK